MRFLCALWLGFGITYAWTTLLAEYYYKKGAEDWHNIPRAMDYMQKAAHLAPQIYNLRMGKVRVVMLNLNRINPLLGGPILAEEINRYPYETRMIWAYLDLCAPLDQNKVRCTTMRRK